LIYNEFDLLSILNCIVSVCEDHQQSLADGYSKDTACIVTK